jgi:hypothetical protein
MNKIELKSVDLTNLKDVCKLIEIGLANSGNIIDEMEGPEYFYVRVDTSKNMAIPYNDDKDLSLMEQFTNADYAGIYETYIEWQSFEGMYSIYPIDENQDWNLEFHGSSLEDESGEITEDNKDKIMEVINPKSLYKLANEVLQACR